MSFTDRANLKVDGYAPFKDAKAYHTIQIEDQKTYMSRINPPAAATNSNTQNQNIPPQQDNQLASVEGEILFYL